MNIYYGKKKVFKSFYSVVALAELILLDFPPSLRAGTDTFSPLDSLEGQEMCLSESSVPDRTALRTLFSLGKVIY